MQRLSRNWIRILITSLVVRLAIAPWFHGFNYDMFIYGNWADTLQNHRFQDFYSYAESPDHLPGDLYIHWVLSSIFHLFGGENLYGAPYRYLLKAFPAIIDIVAAVLIWRFLRSRVSEQNARNAAIAFAANPAIIFLSSAWGQWDVVSGAIFLAGLTALWSPKPRIILSAALFGWALLIKPPLMLFVLFAVAGFAWHRYRDRAAIRRIPIELAGLAITAAATVTLLMLPFRMSWFDGWAEFSLVSRLQMAADLYPHTTLGAANIWMIALGSLERVEDSGTIVGVTYQHWGLLLFAVTAIVIFWRTIKAGLTPMWLVWGMVAIGYAYFLLPTRSHERYLFPAILMLIVLTGLSAHSRTIRLLAVAASGVYLLNLILVYGSAGGWAGTVAMVTLSVANLAIFLRLLTLHQEELEEPLAS